MTSGDELGEAWGVAVPDLEAGTDEGGVAGGPHRRGLRPISGRVKEAASWGKRLPSPRRDGAQLLLSVVTEAYSCLPASEGAGCPFPGGLPEPPRSPHQASCAQPPWVCASEGEKPKRVTWGSPSPPAAQAEAQRCVLDPAGWRAVGQTSSWRGERVAPGAGVAASSSTGPRAPSDDGVARGAAASLGGALSGKIAHGQCPFIFAEESLAEVFRTGRAAGNPCPGLAPPPEGASPLPSFCGQVSCPPATSPERPVGSRALFWARSSGQLPAWRERPLEAVRWEARASGAVLAVSQCVRGRVLLAGELPWSWPWSLHEEDGSAGQSGHSSERKRAMECMARVVTQAIPPRWTSFSLS